MAKTKTRRGTTITRRFTIDPHAIMSLIKAQAGSLQKAMLEAVANSMDAGADRIDIKLTGTRVEIHDNGSGLSKEEDIYQFFERFGFDHSQLDRKVGRFGVGRGQLFCFGVNTWRTNGFEMSIDIKNNGLDYDLAKDLPHHPGMSIAIDLDEPMSVAEQLAVEEEFRQLVRYSTVPIHFNGEIISEDPAQAKWTHENDDAWFRVRKDGRLSVYSQGLYVKDIWGHEFGVGGCIVTKPGRALAQNLARNDLLVKECPIWKRLKPEMAKLAAPYREKANTQAYITPEMRKMMARNALTSEGVADLGKGKLFTLSNNKHVDLGKLISTGFVAMAPMFDQVADKLMQRKQAMVLDASTLERFGVDTVRELQGKIKKALQAQIARAQATGASKIDGTYVWTLQHTLSGIDKAGFFESTGDLPFDTEVTFEEVPYRKLRDEEKAVAHALRKQMEQMAAVVRTHRGLPWSEYMPRRLEFFNDNGSIEACTDGVRTVWINRKTMMKKARKGVEGFMELVAVLLHEYLHDQSSQSSHGHPPEFYEDFHNLLLDGNMARMGLSAYAASLRHGPKPTARQLSKLEKLGVEIDVPVGDGAALEAAEEEAEAPAPARPKPRVRKRAAR